MVPLSLPAAPKISSGSFGRVFRADDPRTGRVVAVKVLRRRWSEDQDKIDLFIREGKVGLTLKHPNIVEILAVNQDAATRQYYIVMEFVEGGNLREILQIRKKLERRTRRCASSRTPRPAWPTPTRAASPTAT